jgi:hypothetical protein
MKANIDLILSISTPSHSEIYKAANEGDDPFENDRHFIQSSYSITRSMGITNGYCFFGEKGLHFVWLPILGIYL